MVRRGIAHGSSSRTPAATAGEHQNQTDPQGAEPLTFDSFANTIDDMLDPTLAAAERELVMLEEELIGALPVEEQEVTEIAVLLLQHVSEVTRLGDLDAVMRAEIDRDLDTLAHVVDLVTGPAYLDLTFTFPGGTFSIKSERPELVEHLEAIRSARDPIDAGLRLDFYGMRVSRVIMTILANDKALPNELETIVARKIPLIEDREVPRIWAQVKGEFGTARRGVTLSPTNPAVPVGFLEATSIQEMRSRIGDYLLRIKPQLMLEGLSRGETRSPADVPDLVMLLTATQGLTRLSFSERQLLQTVSRLLRMWEDHEDQLLDGMRLTQWSWAARSAQSWRSAFGGKLPTDRDQLVRLRIRLLRRLVAYADWFAIRQSPLEVALYGFKFGREVMAGYSDEVDRQKLELRLQRDLARFLLERGHFAVGTKFGRAETDLMVTEAGDVVVIEAKRYIRSPSVNSIAGNLSQLQVYVSQQRIPSSRGVLIIFNYSRRHVSAPRHWLRQQFLILPINLGPSSPSETYETLTLEETTGDRVIGGYLIAPQSGTKSSQRARRKRTKEKPGGHRR